MARVFLVMMVLLFPAAVEAQTGVDCDAARDERTCLACNVYFESGTESEEGMLAVALVTLNRKDSPIFARPKSLCAVMRQPGQFSWIDDGNPNVIPNNSMWRDSWRIAGEILADPDRYDFTNGSQFFHHAKAPSSYLRWTKSLCPTLRIGPHVFYRKPDRYHQGRVVCHEPENQSVEAPDQIIARDF